jgi:hypothetical protein
MAQQRTQGVGITPTPITALARDFLAIGGRIMLNPEGGVESAINPMLILGRGVSGPDRRTRRARLRAFVQAEQRHATALAVLVAQNGAARGNGWQVWEAGR